MGPNTIQKIKKIIIIRFKSEITKIQHTIIMKIGRPLDIIVHYTLQFNLECCKIYVTDMGPYTIQKIKKYIIRRLESEVKRNSNIQSL